MLASFSRRDRSKHERGIAMFMMVFLLVIAFPVVGLVFDATMLYLVKARLQGSADGAALAGARALARGANSTAQIQAAQDTATSYIKLNYQTGFFFTSAPNIPTPTVNSSVANQRSVSVTVSSIFPGVFLASLTGPTTVTATATATRRDVNVVIAMDRSGSLAASGSCAPLKAAAVNFVNQFAPGRDNVGLVSFASSTHTDFAIANTFQTASPNVVTMINNITCAGSTSTAEGLWRSYEQLIALNQPGALNVLLLFTDGQPTGVTFDMPVANGSPCTQYTAGSPTGADAYTMPGAGKGYLRGVYNTFTNVNQFFGALDPAGNTNGDLVPAPNSANCTFMNNWAYDGGVHNMTATSDFLGVPAKDIYGNSTNPTPAYQTVSLNSNGFIDLANANNAAAMALNAADSAAVRIRNGATDPVSGNSLSNVITYSIGLGNAAIPASPVFLQRVSNDPSSPIYDNTKPAGKYIFAANASDLQSAFSAVASDILRLAR